MTKLTKQASKALEASIVVWQDKLAVDDADGSLLGPDACPLCLEFFDDHDDPLSMEYCVGCPISARTGRNVCGGTPYGDAARAMDSWEYGEGTKRKFRNAARKMIKFMEGLRDE